MLFVWPLSKKSIRSPRKVKIFIYLSPEVMVFLCLLKGNLIHRTWTQYLVWNRWFLDSDFFLESSDQQQRRRNTCIICTSTSFCSGALYYLIDALIIHLSVCLSLPALLASHCLWSHVDSVCLMIPGLPVLDGRDTAISGINNKKDKQTSRGSRVVAEPGKAAGSSS